MLPVLVGAERLSDVVRKEGADCVIFDTSGLVDPTKGGAALKFAKINLLQPNYVVAIRAEQELEYLLRPLRRSSQAKLIELSSSPAARARSPEQRREHRARQYAEYFKGSKSNIISWPDYAVFPAPHFALNRIVALEDAAGLVIDLGIILKIERQKHEVEIFTPIDSVEKIDGLRIGDVKVDPRTFQDQLIR